MEEHGTPKNHKRIVDLDAGERSATSLYLAVKIYGKVYEPTRVERTLLKMYNTPSVGTMAQFRHRAEYERTRFPGDYNQFVSMVLAYEAYGRVFWNVKQLGDACRGMIKMARAWDNLTVDTEPPTHWSAKEIGEHDKQRHVIAQTFFDDGVEYYGAALYALQQWFNAHGLQPYMTPHPFRFELRTLWDAQECLHTLLRQIAIYEPQERPPFNWDWVKPQMNREAVNFYTNILRNAEKELERSLPL